jgi:hypothetical protein
MLPLICFPAVDFEFRPLQKLLRSFSTVEQKFCCKTAQFCEKPRECLTTKPDNAKSGFDSSLRLYRLEGPQNSHNPRLPHQAPHISADVIESASDFTRLRRSEIELAASGR